MSEEKGTERSTVSVYYCEECKTLCLSFDVNVRVYGVSHRSLDKDGVAREYKFEEDNDSARDNEIKCADCGAEVYKQVEVPFELFSKIRDKLKEDNDSTNFYVDFGSLEDEDVEDLTPQEVYDRIFTSLI